MSNKVLFFVDSLTFGGVEKAILQIMEGMDRNLWQPVLVYHRAENIQPLLQKVDQLEVKRIETPRMPLGTAGMKQIPPLMKILREERPAVFHAHLSWSLACKWGIVTSILARTPVNVITEQLFLDVSYTRMARLQQRLIAAGVGKYIAVSQGIAEKLQQTFQIPKRKIRVIYNAVEGADSTSTSTPQKLIELQRETKKPVVLCVARLDEQKGQRYLLDAALEVPEAIFAFVGEGPDRTKLEDQVHRLKLEDRVLFLGFQHNVRDWLNACNVFVLPSLYEGLPIAILEAMAAGKPVIATDISGNREAVTDGVTGCLVPPQDAHSLAVAIRSLLGDPALGERMGQAGRKIVLEKFSEKEMVRQVTEVYADCLGSRR